MGHTPYLDIEAGRLLSEQAMWTKGERMSWRPYHGEVAFSVTRCENGYVGEINLNPNEPNSVRLLLEIATTDTVEARFVVETEYRRWRRVREKMEVAFPQMAEMELTRISATALAAGAAGKQVSISACKRLIKRMQELVGAAESELNFAELTETVIYEPEFDWQEDVAALVGEIFDLIAKEIWNTDYVERPEGIPDTTDVDEAIERVQMEPGPAQKVLQSALNKLLVSPKLRPTTVRLL